MKNLKQATEIFQHIISYYNCPEKIEYVMESYDFVEYVATYTIKRYGLPSVRSTFSRVDAFLDTSCRNDESFNSYDEDCLCSAAKACCFRDAFPEAVLSFNDVSSGYFL